MGSVSSDSPQSLRGADGLVTANGTFGVDFGEIGYWSELKLEIVEKYGSAYTAAFGRHRLKKYYIDAFSGPGTHVSKESGQQIDGSPIRALRVRPPFDHFYFIDLNPLKTAFLAERCRDRRNVSVINADASKYLMHTLLPTIRFERYNRALCLLDPYGLHLDWGVILRAGRSRAVDMLLNFPVMDMNRNAIWMNPDRAQTALIACPDFGETIRGNKRPTPKAASPIFSLAPSLLSKTTLQSRRLFANAYKRSPVSSACRNLFQ